MWARALVLQSMFIVLIDLFIGPSLNIIEAEELARSQPELWDERHTAAKQTIAAFHERLRNRPLAVEGKHGRSCSK